MNSSSVDTVNAAANAVVSAESRVQQVMVPRRRWRTFFSVYWCFGSPRQTKRINHAVLFPEPISNGPDTTVLSDHPNHPPPITLPFIAPPSSPASFMNSEPPSSAQSPGGFLSLSTLSANAYSPSGTRSIFDIGPYAHETQLVSPPVFSTFTTEPSTAPFTPPEPLQLTTPLSPEVPFAQLLSSFDANCKKREAYEFQSYQLYLGSPIGNLISPSSVCSSTSSPFPDLEFHSSAPPPKILTAERLAEHKLIPHRSSSQKQGSSLDGHIPVVMDVHDVPATANHRVSFELTAEEVVRCMEKKPTKPGKAALRSSFSETEAMSEPTLTMIEAEGNGGSRFESSERIESSGELMAGREFKFSNSDGATAEPSVGSEWWANEKVISADVMPPQNWAFFPMVQPGVS